MNPENTKRANWHIFTIARWLLFLPAGALGSVIAGYIATEVLSYMNIYELFNPLFRSFSPAWLVSCWVWAMSGLASGCAFVVISLKVSPVENNFTKRLIFSIVFTLGVISMIGGLLFSTDKESAMAGVTMTYSAYALLNPFKKTNN